MGTSKDDLSEPCQHRKGKMIAFNEETFLGTWKCKICKQPFSHKASIVCMDRDNFDSDDKMLDFVEGLLSQ